MAGFTVVSHADVILSQIASNAETAMQEAAKTAVEAVQNQILYGYHTPHGPDGHTEIVDTGRLFDSITATVERQSQNLVTASVGTNVPYAGFVHDGTYKLEARPFLRDAILGEETQQKLKTDLSTNLSNGF